MGDVYLAGRFDDEAIEAYKRAIALEPENENEFKWKLVQAYRRMGKPDFADEVRATLPDREMERRREAPPPRQRNLVGEAAPTFTLSDLDGVEVKLADFKGKVLLLNFWAMWCPPCAKEIPHLIALDTQYKEQEFAVVGISVDTDGIDVVKSFVQERGVRYRILIADRKVLDAYGGILSLPTTFVIDRAGNVQHQYVGPGTKAMFEEQINALLADE